MNSVMQKPHAVCIPFPAQSHIKAMLKLAKLLHSQGIHITFVNTEYNHNRLLKSGGPNSLDGSSDFRFMTIPDGLPPLDVDAAQDVIAVCESIPKNFLAPFVSLLENLHASGSPEINPPVTCVVSDGFITFTIDAAERLGIPIMLFWTIPACAFMGIYQALFLIKEGLIPLKDESYLTNGYLDTVVDWIPGMKNIRLKDFPSLIRTTDINSFLLNFEVEAVHRCSKASANIFHTFDELEVDVLTSLSSMIPHLYTIGPIELLMNHILPKDDLNSIGYSLWREEHLCLEWLDSKEENSVIYVNFGSIAVMSLEKLLEVGRGLVNSNKYFLWINRSDAVKSESPVLPPEFLEEIKERGFIAGWCPQEQVLNHSSVGGFLTHGGWNSTIESLSAGVPMICLPLFADQPMNCRYICNEWEVGMELVNDFKSGDVENVVKELMEGEKGKRMKNKAMEWREMAKKATRVGGSSSLKFNMLVNNIFNRIKLGINLDLFA
ncbi:hypothetical protein LguiB_004250 [Lonicera macranthoides]